MYSLEGSYLEIVLNEVLMSERTSSLMQIGAPAVKLQPTRWTPHVIVNFISHLYRYISVYIYIHTKITYGSEKLYRPQKFPRASLFSQ